MSRLRWRLMRLRLQEFYVEIEATRRVDFAALTRILVDYAQSQGTLHA